MIGAMMRDGAALWRAARAARVGAGSVRGPDVCLDGDEGEADRDMSWWRLLGNDAFLVLVSFRTRKAAMRCNIPLVNALLRRMETTVFGVEIDRRAHLGEGVWLVHPLGTVVGGDSRIGDRVRLMGCNTLGTNLDDGYPRLGNDVVVGAGARILGPVRVGEKARIGAGAVVLCDVPAGALAVGVPARVVSPSSRARMGGLHERHREVE